MIPPGMAYSVQRGRECRAPPFAKLARRRRHRSRRSGMSPGTAFHFFHRAGSAESGGSVWALVIAILFAVVAAASFAVDQSVTLSNFPVPAPQTTNRDEPAARVVLRLRGAGRALRLPIATTVPAERRYHHRRGRVFGRYRQCGAGRKAAL